MQEFELYAQKVRDTKPYMDNNKKAHIYGLFKQTKEGDCISGKSGDNMATMIAKNETSKIADNKTS